MTRQNPKRLGLGAGFQIQSVEKIHGSRVGIGIGIGIGGFAKRSLLAELGPELVGRLQAVAGRGKKKTGQEGCHKPH